MRLVVKRRGHRQKYDDKKVYASCYAAALNCSYSEKRAEAIAQHVTNQINAWIKKKKIVTSDEIRDKTIEFLKKKDSDVALMYKHHLDLS